MLPKNCWIGFISCMLYVCCNTGITGIEIISILKTGIEKIRYFANPTIISENEVEQDPEVQMEKSI